MTNITSSMILSQKNVGTRTARTQKMIAHPATASIIDALIPVDVAKSLYNCTAIYRAVQACDFLRGGDLKAFDAVTAYAVAALMLAEQQTVTYADLQFLCGKPLDGAQHIAGVSRARLARYLAPKNRKGRSMTAGEIESKVSRSVGKGGFLRALGIVARNDSHSVTLTESARSHPFMVAYSAALNKVSDADLIALQSTESASE